MKMKCENWRCGWLGDSNTLLRAPNPFEPDEELTACPQCKGFDVSAACDEPVCTRAGGCGWPTKDGGYRHTCWEHSDFRGWS